uniref:Uncharacterized protein n=1 Tax=Caenorhabditis japonica TaxID=281687 RepID=A0A8R1E3J0_CAEJA
MKWNRRTYEAEQKRRKNWQLTQPACIHGHTSSSHQRILMVQTNDESLNHATAKTHRLHTTMRLFTKLSPPHFSTRSSLQQLRYLGPPPTSASARKIHGVAMKWIGINVDNCIYLTLQKECIL